MSDFNWDQVGSSDHGALDNLGKDRHPQYLNAVRHNDPKNHSLGGVVPHDVHGEIEELGADNHVQYINGLRHDRKHHLSSVVPAFCMVVSGGSISEPVFTMDGDIIVTEVI